MIDLADLLRVGRHALAVLLALLALEVVLSARLEQGAARQQHVHDVVVIGLGQWLGVRIRVCVAGVEVAGVEVAGVERIVDGGGGEGEGGEEEREEEGGELHSES